MRPENPPEGDGASRDNRPVRGERWEDGALGDTGDEVRIEGRIRAATGDKDLEGRGQPRPLVTASSSSVDGTCKKWKI